jgi:hypothetical protein
MDRPTIYFPPSLAHFSPHREPEGGWPVHLGVAYDLVAAVRPRLVVGVGVRHGAMYLACCQSVREHDLDSLCYAVGTWAEEGEATGRAANRTLDDFANHNRFHYAVLSYILRLTSNQALPQFDDGSVDLVLLDEDCGDEAFEECFRSWYPKVRPGGVLAVHDVGATDSRRRDVWERLREDRSAFVFDGDPALGVVRVQGPVSGDDRFLRLLFESDPGDQQRLRASYARGARYLELDRTVGATEFGHAKRGRAGRAEGAP